MFSVSPSPSFLPVTILAGVGGGSTLSKPRELSAKGEGSHSKCRFDEVVLPLQSESLRRLLIASEPQIRAPTTGRSPTGPRPCLPGPSDTGPHVPPTSSSSPSYSHSPSGLNSNVTPLGKTLTTPDQATVPTMCPSRTCHTYPRGNEGLHPATPAVPGRVQESHDWAPCVSFVHCSVPSSFFF